MSKRKKSEEAEKGNQPSGSNSKILILTTIITALIGLIGTFITVYVQEVGFGAKSTQTAAASTSEAIANLCPPLLMPTEMAILRKSVNVDQAGVYYKKDQSIKPFQILNTGDVVEVVNNEDPVWSCITYSKDDVRVFGFILRDQLTTIETIYPDTTKPATIMANETPTIQVTLPFTASP